MYSLVTVINVELLETVFVERLEPEEVHDAQVSTAICEILYLS